MSEPPSGAGGLSPGDPLGGGPAAEPPRHDSGLPGIPPAPERPAPGPGYSSPPPPGAGGPVAPASHGDVMGRYVLASWGSRAAAQVVDGVIIGIGALILFLPLGAALGIGAASGNDTGVGAVVVGALFWVLCVSVIALLYAPILMARTNGKTFGRMLLNIRVVRTSGERITFGVALLRGGGGEAVGVRDAARGGGEGDGVRVPRLDHRGHREPRGLPVAAVGRGEPLPARLR